MNRSQQNKPGGMSRKTLFMAMSALLAIGSSAARNFGIDMSYESITGALMPMLMFIFGQGKMEQKMDRSTLHRKDKNRYKAPEFWITLAGTVMPLLNDLLELGIPADTIPTVFTGLLTLIFCGKYSGIKRIDPIERKKGKK